MEGSCRVQGSPLVCPEVVMQDKYEILMIIACAVLTGVIIYESPTDTNTMRQLCQCGSGEYTDQGGAPCQKCSDLPKCPDCKIPPRVYPMAQCTYIGCDDCGFENERIYEDFDAAREAWIEKCGQND